MKMGFLYKTAYPLGTKDTEFSLTFEDGNFAGHAGWKEIIVSVRPRDKLIRSSAPTKDRSSEPATTIRPIF